MEGHPRGYPIPSTTCKDDRQGRSSRFAPPRTEELQLRTFRTRIHARSYELDSFGHVNHAAYLNFLEHARWEALAAGGFGYSDILALGLGVHVVRLTIEYKAEIMMGDELEIETQVTEFRRTSMTLEQTVYRNRSSDSGGAVLAAEASVVGVWIGTNGKPIRVPSQALEALT